MSYTAVKCLTKQANEASPFNSSNPNVSIYIRTNVCDITSTWCPWSTENLIIYNPVWQGTKIDFMNFSIS
jgi:hypothetical protein